MRASPVRRRRSMDAEGAVTYQVRDRVAWVGLNRPRKRNAINDSLLGELLAAARRAQEEARALVVFGHGPCFCAGLDLAEHRAREPAEVFHHSRSWHTAFSVLRRGQIPAIAALHGATVGGAGELAAKVAEMAPLTVLGVLQALPRIQDMGEDDGLFVESMMAALAQTGPEAAARLADFVAKRGAKVSSPSEG